jgi:hypothetical protein
MMALSLFCLNCKLQIVFCYNCVNLKQGKSPFAVVPDNQINILLLPRGHNMKRILLGCLLAGSSVTAFAGAAGSSECGWGQILFEGQSGKVSHILALTTNASTGNNTFGVTTGTNGCSGSGTISYGGKSMVDVSVLMDEFSEDVARGDGEVITAVAVSLGIKPEDRAEFKEALHENYDKLFPSQDVTTDEMLSAMWTVMEQDETLKPYVS